MKESESVSRSAVCDSLRPMDYSPSSSSVHGILQARIPEWVAIPFSRGSSWPRDWSQVSCTAGRFFTVWATRETPSSSSLRIKSLNYSREWGNWGVIKGRSSFHSGKGWEKRRRGISKHPLKRNLWRMGRNRESWSLKELVFYVHMITEKYKP